MVGDQTIHYERSASVQVEGNDNTAYNLVEMLPGIYHSDQLHLNNLVQYRLHIKTTDGAEYISDFSESKLTPAIDGLYWTRQQIGDSVRIYLNTHDPANNSRYYKWEYEETWEFHMPYVPKMKYDTIVFEYPTPRRITVSEAPPDSSHYVCWSNDTSTSLLLGSSERLSSDIITNFLLTSIPPGSIKLSVEYSILVKQYALTKEAYEFLQVMKKNTEETGSIFDPQPSELKGNIHNPKNPAEIVVGYVSVSELQQQRIFISSDQVPGWNYDPQCDLRVIPNVSLKDTQQVKAAISAGLLPIKPKVLSSGNIDSFYAASPLCADCRKMGVLTKPPFWQ
jgi:hypothetical protein